MFLSGNRSLIRVGLAASVALTAAGCDSATSSTSSAGGSSIAIDDLPNQLKATFCKIADCMDMWFSTPTGCADTMGEFGAMDQIAWVKAGLITYDGTKARACLDAMASSCSLEGAEPEACRLTFVGTVADGAACDDDAFCKSGFCKTSGTSNCGICTAPGAEGAACFGSSSCAAGLGCVKGACAVPGSIAAGKPCGQDRDCATDHYCKHEGNNDTCAPKGAKDEACGLQSQSCKAGLVCSGDFSTGQLESGKCGAAHKAGETCGNPYNSDCEKGLICGFAMPSKAGDKLVAKCVARVKTGQACEFTVQCGVDGWCTGGKCAPLPKAGEVCGKNDSGNDQLCGPNLECGTDSKCAAMPSVGATCNYSCATGASCVGSKCVADSAVGGPCSTDNNGPRCKAGLFCGTAGTCSATPVCK